MDLTSKALYRFFFVVLFTMLIMILFFHSSWQHLTKVFTPQSFLQPNVYANFLVTLQRNHNEFLKVNIVLKTLNYHILM